MDVVVDTDVLSTFSKIERLELLQKLFRKSTIIIAPSVYKEIRKAERLGIVEYHPPSRFSKTKLVPLERRLARDIIKNKKLGSGDAECIAIAKFRNCLLLTNDHEAERVAGSLSINCFNLPLILGGLWKQGVMRRERLFELAAEIERNDHVLIKDLEFILS